MTIYEESEYNLAALLGWQRLSLSGGTVVGYPPDGNESHRFQAAVPRWTRDDAEAFKLFVLHNVEFTFMGGSVWASSPDCYKDHLYFERYENHPDKLTAVRYAGVMVLVEMLSVIDTSNCQI